MVLLHPLVLESSLSSQRALEVPQPSLYGLSLCCVEAVQLAFSCLLGGTTLNIGVYLMCYWDGAKSVSSNTTILDLPLTRSVLPFQISSFTMTFLSDHSLARVDTIFKQVLLFLSKRFQKDIVLFWTIIMPYRC